MVTNEPLWPFCKMLHTTLNHTVNMLWGRWETSFRTRRVGSNIGQFCKKQTKKTKKCFYMQETQDFGKGLFHQDNWATLEWFAAKNVNVLQWPSQSLPLNLIKICDDLELAVQTFQSNLELFCHEQRTKTGVSRCKSVQRFRKKTCCHHCIWMPGHTNECGKEQKLLGKQMHEPKCSTLGIFHVWLTTGNSQCSFSID